MDFFEEQDYLKSKQKFETGKIWNKLVEDYNNFTDKQIHQFYEQFEQLKNYGDKLRFWKKNRLSPVKLQYTFKLTIENHPKEETIMLSLHPLGNEEKKLYLNWLIEHCYENFASHSIEYNFETIPLEELKQRFAELKGDFAKNIENEISLTKQRIKSKNVDTDVYSYLTYKKNEPNLLSDLQIESRDVLVSLQYFAIRVAFVYDFLKYLLFLEDCKTDNRISKSDTKHISFTDKSFKAKEDIDLIDLYSFLIENKFIEDTDYQKFENVFNEVIIKEKIKKQDKINWISRSSKGVNWQALYVLIHFCCEKETFKNIPTDIEKKLDKCFTAPDNGFARMDSFSRAGISLEDNNFSTRFESVKKMYDYFH